MSNYPQCEHTHKRLRELQALPLREKIFESRMRIAEWARVWGEENMYVAFSGGKDSTVLLDLVRRDYPDTPAVFVNTGLEFPEIVYFVRTVDNVVWLKPKMRFDEVIEKYGYPVVSKKVADYVGRCQRTSSKDVLRRHINGENSDGSKSTKSMIPLKWQPLIDAPFKISDKCCDVMKKHPINSYAKDSGQYAIVGVMADESETRKQEYINHGCNAFELEYPISKPISFWSTKDVWAYIKLKSLPYASIYDMGYKRTGCTFCMFGCNAEQKNDGENRFQKMERTHPKLWEYCMYKLGLKEVLEYIGLPHKHEWDMFLDNEEYED